MNTDHVAPILFVLQNDDTGSLHTVDGSVPVGTEAPYRVVYTTVGTPDPVSMEEAADRVLCTVIVHNVGGSAAAARVIADRTAAVLIGLRPTVAGRDCGRVRLVDAQPARRDESAITPIFDQVDVYQYTTVPSTT